MSEREVMALIIHEKGCSQDGVDIWMLLSYTDYKTDYQKVLHYSEAEII